MSRYLPLIAAALLFQFASLGQDTPNPTWVVGTRDIPPFAIKQPDGSWKGLSIELWDRVAKEAQIDYTLRELPTPESLIDSVAGGEVNASIAAISATPERAQHVDFSYPFYDSGLAIAVPKAKSGWAGVFRSLFSPAFLGAVGALALVLMLAAVGLWLFERRLNPEQFGGPPVRGLGSAFWWSAVTMTTVGYGDKAPQTVGGRLVALVWMFTSIIIISSFTATIASSLTISRAHSKVDGPQDLPRFVSSTVAGSTAESYLIDHQARRATFDSVPDALEALRAGKVDACVYDEPMLRYFAHELPDVIVLPGKFKRQGYAVALSLGNARRKDINVAILQQIQTNWWRSRCTDYLGQ